MSYILEALKKAQAERQLGSAPTIHAVPIQGGAAERERARSLPLMIGLGVVAVATAGAVAWWTQRTPPPAPVPGAVVLPAQGAGAVVVPGQAAGPVAPHLVVTQAAPLPPLGQGATGIGGTAPMPVAGASAVSASPPQQAAAQRAPVPPPVAAAPAAGGTDAVPAPEENLPLLTQLPESQRAGLPQVSFGGYMYSRNPADRLLLIDKVLRREGEEVAPGLVLERLLPRAAVMNYRGTRYRVPY